MSEPTADELAMLLSEGLDLCVRAEKLDEQVTKAVAISGATGTRCLTPALWVQDLYDRDLKEWRTRAQAMLGRLPMFATPSTSRGSR